MTLTNLLIVALATFRLSRMVAYEEGPWSMFVRIRALCRAYDVDLDNEPVYALGRWITCPLCVGVPIGLVFLTFMLFPFLTLITYLFAALGLATIIHMVEWKLQERATHERT